MVEFKTEESVFINDLKMLYEFYDLKGKYKEDVQIMLDTLGKNKYDENCNIKPNAIVNSLLKIEKILED